MKSTLIAATAAAALIATAANAADPPKDRPADRMAGMQMSGPMSMGIPLSPMPSVYAGQADKKGAPVFKGLGAHHMAISTKNPQTQKFFDKGSNCLSASTHPRPTRPSRE